MKLHISFLGFVDMAFNKKEATNVIHENDAGRLTVDAVHPFFKGYNGQFRDAQTSTEDDLAYHCKECCLYFPKNLQSVLEHFQNRTHMPVDSCVYCCGPVCEYFYNDIRLIYHSCEESKPNRTSSSFLSILKRKLSIRNQSCDVS